jgi:hypothetical protein
LGDSGHRRILIRDGYVVNGPLTNSLPRSQVWLAGLWFAGYWPVDTTIQAKHARWLSAGGVAMSDILSTAVSDQEQVSVRPRQELSTQQKEWVRASIDSLQATTVVSDEPKSTPE